VIVFRELHLYWDYTGGNVAAMPLCGLVAVVSAVCFRKPLARWYHKHLGMRAELAEIRELAAKAHRIAADTYRHQTGQHHPDAPDRTGPGT
jgi:hypothetical protein